MAVPTEHQVCLILFAKNTGLKTRAGYHHCNPATAVRTSSRSARSERVLSANREALSMRASRAPALRAFLGGRSIIVTQFLSPVLGNRARNASRNSPKTRARSGVGTRAARRGERCGTPSKARRVYAEPE
jgi:hypothetical protein